MNPTVVSSGKVIDAGLAQACLQQLGREQANLETMRQVQEQMRAALLGAEPAALAAVLQRQQEAAGASDRLRQERERFRQEMAQALAVAAQTITLPWLAGVLGGATAQRLLQGREALQRLSEEVRRLNESNAALMYYCLDFLNRFFCDLTGGQVSGCYGPVGTLQEAPCGSIIEARG